MSELSGSTIRSYKFMDEIGRGGFGAVYRATQPLLKRDVAIKVILPQYANNADFIRRFAVEAELVARLEHPHIVPLYDYWREPDGAFLVMRWLSGGSLRDLMQGHPLPTDLCLKLVDQICRALAVAHRNNVIHRDLKPDNILLDEEQNGYLADFGIARINDGTAATEGDGIKGTPAYIAPEQIQNGDISPRTDIYSLGVMVFEMLTGERPYPNATPSELIFKHLLEPLPYPTTFNRDLPPVIDDVLEKATAKQPEERYPDTLAFAEAFINALGGQSTAAQTPIPFQDRTPDLLADTPTIVELPDDIENPYRGLQAFREADADAFFGRETLVGQLVAEMTDEQWEARFLAVLGASGSGKSSLVRAGLIPALRRGDVPGAENWFIAEMFPSVKPFNELETALTRVAVNPPTSLLDLLQEPDGIERAVKRILPADEAVELVLLIDQFEELFTLTNDEAARRRFLDNLVSALQDPRSRLRVVVTMRADFFDRPLQYLEFGELLRQRVVTLLPMSPEELREAITRPAQNLGATFETGLVDLIIKDVGEQPGTLPLLQYALTELFERRDGALLTQQAYEEIGGVIGALSRRAEEIYAAMGTDNQAVTRQLFLRLVMPGDGGDDTRRRVRQIELDSLSAHMNTVINRFARSRLLTFDRDADTRVPTVEVAHEALIRSWGRLRGWLNDEREGLLIQRRLTTLAAEWEAMDHDPGLLVSGPRLNQFEAWAQSTTLSLNLLEQRFLTESIRARELQQREEAERQAREQQRERALRRFQAGLAAVIALALAIGLIGALYINQQTAQGATAVAQQRDRAATNEAIARFNEATAEENAAIAATQRAAAENNAATATVAQGDALNQANNAATQAAIAQRNAATATVAQGDALVQANNAATQQAIAQTQAAAAQRNAATATVAQGDALNQANNAATQAAIAQRNAATATVAQGDALNQADNAATQQAIAENNAATATVAQGEALNQADNAATQQAIAQTQAAVAAENEVAAEQSANRASTQAANAEIARATAERSAAEARSLAQAAQAQRLFNNGQPLLAYSLALSANSVADAPFLAEQSLGEVAYAPGPRRVFDGHEGIVRDVAYHPDGRHVLSASNDGTIILWDVETGTQVRTYAGHSSWVVGVDFTTDGQFIVSGSGDSFVRLWNTDSGELIHTMAGHEGYVFDVAFSLDGRYAVSGGQDGTVIVWDVLMGQMLRRMEGHSDQIREVAFSPDGRFAASASDDLTVILWDWKTGEIVHEMAHRSEVYSLDFSPDGQRLLTGTLSPASLTIWSVSEATPIREFQGHTDGIETVAYSPDGRYVLSNSFDDTVILWDITSADPALVFNFTTDDISAVAFSPDGTRIVTGTRGNYRVIVWDLFPGDLVRRFGSETESVRTVDFSPDGRYALSGNALDDDIILWDVETGQSIRQFIGHTGDVMNAQFSLDGRYIVSGGTDDLAIIWDVETGSVLRLLESHQGDVNAVAFSPDGRYAVTGSDDATLILWDVASGEPLRTFERHTESIRAVAFSPDGQQIASASWDGTTNVWATETGEILQTIEGHLSNVDDVVFSPDGQYIITGGSDNLVILWDWAQGSIVRTMTGHRNGVDTIAYSPNGRHVLSGSRDGTMVLWDITTGNPIRSFTGIDGLVNDVVFSPDGRLALSAISDGTPLLWRIDTRAELIAWTSENRAVTEPDCDIRTTYQIVPACDDGGAFPTRTPYPTPTPDTALAARTLPDITPIAPATPNALLADTTAATFALFQPMSGELVHDASDTSPVFVDTNALVEGFVAEVRFLNPFGADRSTFDYGFVFGDYVLLLDDARTWNLWYLGPGGPTGSPIRRGPVSNLDVSEGGMNDVQFIVRDGAGLLYVNGVFTANLDVSQYTGPTSLLLITGFISGDEITGEATGYQDFVVRSFEAPIPTATPNPAPRQAVFGSNRGKVPRGGGEVWTFEGTAGQVISLAVRAERPANTADEVTREAENLLDTRVIVYAPDGAIIAEADDIENGVVTDSAIDALLLPQSGVYTIEVRSWRDNTSGAYTLEIGDAALPVPTPTASGGVSPTLIPGTQQPDGSILVEVASGNLVHTPTTSVVPTVSADVFLRDFDLEVRFLNPYATATAPWDYGVVFRQTLNGDYTLILSSDGEWVLLEAESGNTGRSLLIQRGEIPNFDSSADGATTIRLVARGGSGLLSINGEPVAILDLSSIDVAGDILVGSGFFPGNQAEGGVTRFENLIIRSVAS